MNEREALIWELDRALDEIEILNRRITTLEATLEGGKVLTELPTTERFYLANEISSSLKQEGIQMEPYDIGIKMSEFGLKAVLPYDMFIRFPTGWAQISINFMGGLNKPLFWYDIDQVEVVKDMLRDSHRKEGSWKRWRDKMGFLIAEDIRAMDQESEKK